MRQHCPSDCYDNPGSQSAKIVICNGAWHGEAKHLHMLRIHAKPDLLVASSSRLYCGDVHGVGLILWRVVSWEDESLCHRTVHTTSLCRRTSTALTSAPRESGAAKQRMRYSGNNPLGSSDTTPGFRKLSRSGKALTCPHAAIVHSGWKACKAKRHHGLSGSCIRDLVGPAGNKTTRNSYSSAKLATNTRLKEHPIVPAEQAEYFIIR